MRTIRLAVIIATFRLRMHALSDEQCIAKEAHGYTLNQEPNSYEGFNQEYKRRYKSAENLRYIAAIDRLAWWRGHLG
jgi:hypothetical protein